jgi:hypothetical protein
MSGVSRTIGTTSSRGRGRAGVAWPCLAAVTVALLAAQPAAAKSPADPVSQVAPAPPTAGPALAPTTPTLAPPLGPAVAPGPPEAVLAPGQTLAAGQSRATADGHYTLVMQGDGSLVDYVNADGAPRRPVWSTRTQGTGLRATMQTDGNLVVYTADDAVAWASGTDGHPGAQLVVQPDGNLVIYEGAAAIWASGQLGSAIHAGEGLQPGQYVLSPNGRYQLVMQADGNLVEYAAGRRAVWASGTDGHPGATLAMQADGNLVVYGPDGAPLWASGTMGRGGSFVMPGDDGNLVLYAAGSAPVWATGTIDNQLAAGERIMAGQSLDAPNGRYRLAMQTDGNLVLYDGDRPRWSSDTRGKGLSLQLRKDGDLVIFKADGHPLWSTASGKDGDTGSRLVMQTDGNLVIYRKSGRAVWSTTPPPTIAAPRPSAALTQGGCGSTPGPGDAVVRWTPVAVCVLAMLDEAPTPQLVGAVLAVISCESGGHVGSVNRWDSNALAGTPSKGLVQVIQPTFDAHRSPALEGDIFDPAANIFAGMDYAIGRYGSILNIPTVKTGVCQGY